MTLFISIMLTHFVLLKFVSRARLCIVVQLCCNEDVSMFRTLYNNSSYTSLYFSITELKLKE